MAARRRPTLTDQPTAAEAVSESGHITGLRFGGNTDGFLWHQGRLTEIQPPPGAEFLQPYGINNRVQIVGYTELGAFLWERGRMTTLPRLVSTTGAYDINDRGQIVGFSAIYPDGTNYHAVLWTR